MRACVQRVSEARVTVAGEIVGQIGRGLVVLLGVAAEDSSDDGSYLADKIAELRIFPDDAGKMNRALQEVGGEMLVISQFTLLGDCRKGRRPSFIDAAEPAMGELLYKEFVTRIAARGIVVATGQFRQHMDVTLTNDGPVTLLLDSKKTF
jgi:D-tyrosyl-tRNA(Tyr) deacylase